MISDFDKYSKSPVVYRGEDAVDKFLKCLEKEQRYIQEKVDFIEPMRIGNEEEQMFQDATNCHICGFELGTNREIIVTFLESIVELRIMNVI